MIELECARRTLLDIVKNDTKEYINLTESEGRVLAQDIYSTIDSPPFDKSPLDGYAVLSEDLKGCSIKNPFKLKVIDKIYAGQSSNFILKKGEAIRIMTGAPIPKGADCIVRQEDTEECGVFVKVFVEHKSYDNYCYKAEDFKLGDKILEKNIIIKSSQIMALASLGISNILVYKKPIIGIITTGSELQNVGENLTYGKIYDSNLYFLYSRILELGAIPKIHNAICDDDDDEISKAITKLENACDLIVSTGGVSVGEKDRVKDSVKICGYDILFWKINIKPGSPMFGAIKNNKLFIGLSGTPVAAATTFELLVRPIIAKILSCKEYDLRTVKAVLQDDFNKVTSKRRFLRVKLDSYEKNKVYINNTYQSPGQINTMLNSNAILEVKSNVKLNKGDIVEVLI